MSDEKYNEVVQAGYVTVQTQVGAGRAYVDVPQGQPLPEDVSDEDRERLRASGAIGGGTGSYVPAGRPVPGEVEPDEIDTDVIPGGSTDEVLAWIGDDLARARVARHEEKAKGDKARAGLIEAIEQKMKPLETEPPTVPEFYDESAGVSPAPAGGVATPSEDPGAGEGKPADEVGDTPAADEAPPAKRTRAARS